MKTRSTELWLGYDGSYVLSKNKLYVQKDPTCGNLFLAPKRGRCLDIDQGDLVFKSLKLKHLEVIKISIERKL